MASKGRVVPLWAGGVGAGQAPEPVPQVLAREELIAIVDARIAAANPGWVQFVDARIRDALAQVPPLSHQELEAIIKAIMPVLVDIIDGKVAKLPRFNAAEMVREISVTVREQAAELRCENASLSAHVEAMKSTLVETKEAYRSLKLETEALMEAHADLKAENAALQRNFSDFRKNAMSFAGTFNRAVEYTRGDTVLHKGGQWFCAKLSCGETPGEGSTSWVMLEKTIERVDRDRKAHTLEVRGQVGAPPK